MKGDVWLELGRVGRVTTFGILVITSSRDRSSCKIQNKLQKQGSQKEKALKNSNWRGRHTFVISWAFACSFQFCVSVVHKGEGRKLKKFPMNENRIELQAADHHLHEKLLKVWWPFLLSGKVIFREEMQAFTRQISHVIMSQISEHIFPFASWVVYDYRGKWGIYVLKAL